MSLIRVDPDAVEAYVRSSIALNEELGERANALIEAYNAAAPGITWGSFDASGALSQLATYLSLNADDDRWAGVVAQAFREADARYGGEVPEQAILSILADMGLDVPRQDLTVEDVAAIGFPPSSGYANDPVCTATGHFVEVELDLPMPWRAGPLAVQRTYTSRHLRSGPFGRGWASWLTVGIDRRGSSAEVTGIDGARRTHSRVGDAWLRPVGEHARLVDADDGLALVHPNRDRWDFDAHGHLVSVRSGVDTVVFERDGHRVTRLVHDHGRELDVSWDGDRVARITSDDGREVGYRYDHAGDLVHVAAPRGERRYDVDAGGRVTRVVDADGVVEAANTYDGDGRVIEQTSAFGRVTRFGYEAAGVTVVGDDGIATTFLHDEAGRLLGVVDDDGARLTRTYDAFGNVAGTRDRTGAVRSFVHDDHGRLVREESPSGLVTTLSHDGLGRVVARTSGDASVRLRYDGEDRQPVEVVDPLGAVTTTAVVDGEIVAVTDQDGITTRLTRDRDGLVTAVTTAAGVTMRFERDGAGELVAVVDGAGRRTVFSRDVGGRVTGRTAPDGAVTAWERSPAGRVLAATSARGAVSRIEHGQHGEPVRMTDPTGIAVEQDWDVHGRLAVVRDATGAEVRHDHDGLSRLVALTDPTGATWQREHDAEGRITATVDPVGRRTERRYDTAGRLVAHVAPGGATTRLRHDLHGRVVEVTRPDGAALGQEWDAAGRLVAQTVGDLVLRRGFTPGGRLAWLEGPGGRREFVHVDGELARVEQDGLPLAVLHRGADGQVERVTDDRGRSVTAVVDEAGRVVGVDGDDGARWRRTFDEVGRVVALTGLDGAETRIERDLAGRVAAITDPVGGRTTFDHDERGFLAGTTDPAGGRQVHDLDAGGRLVGWIDALGRRTSLHHDASGRLVSRTDPTGTVSFDLDDAGRTVGWTDRAGRHVSVDLDDRGLPRSIDDGERRIELGWDDQRRLVSRIVDGHEVRVDHGPHAVTVAAGGTPTTFERDGDGRVTTIEHPTAGRATLTRDDAGRVLRFVAPGLERRFTWDHDGRLVGLRQDLDGTSDEVRLRHDRAGRVVAVEGADGTTSLLRDAAGQLTGLDLADGRTWRWTYQHGRRVEEVRPDGTTRRFRHDVAGQLVAVEDADGTTRLIYDAAGRRTGQTGPRGTRAFTWDGLGRLVGVHGDGVDVALGLDPQGDPVVVDARPVTWDHSRVLPVVRAVGATQVVGGLSPLAVVDADGERWLPVDGFGTPGAPDLATSVGLLAGRGVALDADADRDGAVGLGMRGELAVGPYVWMRNRVYDPDLGVFLSPDPLPPAPGSAQVANPYHYAGNDPVGLVDPWGLQPLSDAELAEWSDAASRGFGERMADTTAEFVDDPVGWVQDNAEAIAAGVVIVAGVAMIATGVGAPIGAGILIGATASMAGQVAFTGEVDAGQVLVSAIAGGAGGGAGMAFSGATLPTRIAAGAGTDAVFSAGGQLYTTGRVDPTALTIDTIAGGGGAAAGGLFRGVDVPPTAAGLAGAVDATPTTTALEIHPFSSGASSLTTTETLARFPNSPHVGNPAQLWVAPRSEMDELLASTTTRGELEVALGLDAGQLGHGNVVRIDVDDPFQRHLRQPDPKLGNIHHRPDTGLTTGSLHEQIMDTPYRSDPGVRMTELTDR